MQKFCITNLVIITCICIYIRLIYYFLCSFSSGNREILQCSFLKGKYCKALNGCYLKVSCFLHYMERIDIVFSSNFSDTQNVWISMLNIFTNTWDKSLKVFEWVKINISKIVVTNFCNNQFMETKKEAKFGGKNTQDSDYYGWN